MVSAWMAANRLQLNHAKTDVLWCSSSRRQHQVPTDPVRIGNTEVLPVKSSQVFVYSVRDLGVYIDADVTMRAHVTTVVRLCFAALRQIRSVRRSLPRHAFNAGLWLRHSRQMPRAYDVEGAYERWLQNMLNRR